MARGGRWRKQRGALELYADAVIAKLLLKTLGARELEGLECQPYS